MSSDMSKIALVREMLDSAERSVREARRMLAELTGDLPGVKNVDLKFQNLAKPKMSGEGRIIEGVFDGQNMTDGEGNAYPVPANYASKSKLVVGDHMKLTITPEARFIYKSIGPIPRKNVMGTLTYEDGRYKVLANGKAYNVLLASVTFLRAEVGDEVSVLLPQQGESDWATLDAVIPHTDLEENKL